MKFGIENISLDGQFGMSLLHMEAIKQTAESKNIVIGIRPVSKFALAFIEDGCPTKPFAIKNKSSRIGVAAGLIVINPEYCQVPDAEYKKYSALLTDALANDPDLKPIPCTISESRINDLIKYFGSDIVIHPLVDSFFIIWQKEGKTIQVMAKKNAQTNDYTIFDDTDKPLQVLGKSITDSLGRQFMKPVTADYDLLVICPTYNDYNPGGKDRTPFSTQAPLHRIQSIIRESILPNYTGPREDTKGGNWSERTKEVVAAINENIANGDVKRKGINLETVHHNSEFHNPFANDLSCNLPCLIILPQIMDLSSMTNTADNISTIILIESQKELQNLCAIIYENEYYWPAHSKYPYIKATRQADAIVAINQVLECKINSFRK